MVKLFNVHFARKNSISNNMIKKILIAKEKQGDRIFDISTPELRKKVFLKLVREREKDNWYSEWDLQNKLIEEAIKGNASSAEKVILFRSRDGYEYEEVEEIKPE